MGGIYTVLQSKAARMKEYYGENYVLIGPFFDLAKTKGEFEETSAPEFCREHCALLSNEGIRLHWGKWLIPGSPRVCLIDFSELLGQTNAVKETLWNEYKIDSLNTFDDFNHPIIWGWACGRVIDILVKAAGSKHPVAHFHEWLAASGLLYLHRETSGVKTIFTTHATVLGRAIAGSGVSLYERIKEFNGEDEAYKLGVYAKHFTEKAAAQVCDVLTTVSEVTAAEVEVFLERKPDIILPNGLNLSDYPTMEEIAVKHQIYREKMREFLLYYFLPYYDIDIQNTLFYFISGRYEVENKGIDIFIQALGEVNERLKKEKKPKTVVAFLFIPAAVRGIVSEIIENREHFHDIKRLLEEEHDFLMDRMLYGVAAKKEFTPEFLFTKERAQAIEVKLKKLTQDGTPPLSTHDVVDQNDRILRLLKESGLLNQSSDHVKVIYYPVYISGGDGLLNLDYSEVIMGAHLGVFPSYYEPWGYTPLETAALGVASLTTDMAGFGQFIKQIESKKEPSPFQGIYVLERMGKEKKEIKEHLASILFQYAKFSREERVENKLLGRKLAEHADWKELITHYFKAHEQALA